MGCVRWGSGTSMGHSRAAQEPVPARCWGSDARSQGSCGWGEGRQPVELLPWLASVCVSPSLGQDHIAAVRAGAEPPAAPCLVLRGGVLQQHRRCWPSPVPAPERTCPSPQPAVVALLQVSGAAWGSDVALCSAARAREDRVAPLVMWDRRGLPAGREQPGVVSSPRAVGLGGTCRGHI